MRRRFRRTAIVIAAAENPAARTHLTRVTITLALPRDPQLLRQEPDRLAGTAPSAALPPCPGSARSDRPRHVPLTAGPAGTPSCRQSLDRRLRNRSAQGSSASPQLGHLSFQSFHLGG